MGRRLLSHLLIALAVFVLTATFFIWTIESRVLNPQTLSGELRKAGVGQELSKLLPEMISNDNNEGNPQEIAEMKEKVSKALTAEYVDEKITTIAETVLGYVQDGSPQPAISLNDFPAQLEAVGVEVGADMKEEFAKPIKLNEEGKLDALPKAYDTFALVKYIGLLLFVGLLIAEWFVAEKGQKLRRTSRVFLYAGLWYLFYWLMLIVVPSQLSVRVKDKLPENVDLTGMLDAVLRAIQGLFTMYFLSFALSCLIIALILYIIRHYKHGDVLPKNNSTVASKARKK